MSRATGFFYKRSPASLCPPPRSVGRGSFLRACLPLFLFCIFCSSLSPPSFGLLLGIRSDSIGQMLSAVSGGLSIAHSIGLGHELVHGAGSLLDAGRDSISLLAASPSPSPSECDERCRTIWGLGAYGDWEHKCTQSRCSACSECANDSAPTPLDLCKARYTSAIAGFPTLENDREATLRGDRSMDPTNIPHVLFVHIGKTCGDTVIAALNHNSRKIRSLDTQQQQSGSSTYGRYEEIDQMRRVPFDMVHVHPVRAEVLEHVTNVLIPMRDPVERLISAYNTAACKAEGVEDYICDRKAPPHKLNLPPRPGLGPIPEVGGLMMQCFPNVTAFGDGIDDDSECGRVARDVIGEGHTDAGHVGKGDCYYLGGMLEKLEQKNIHLIHTEHCGEDIGTIANWLGLQGDNSQFESTPDRHQGDYPHHYDTVSARGRLRLEHHLQHEYALQAEIRRLAKIRETDGEPKEGCVSTGGGNLVSNKWCTINCAAGNCPPLMCSCAGDAAKKQAAEDEVAKAKAAAEKAAVDQKGESERAAKANAEAIESAKKEQATRETEEQEKSVVAKAAEADRAAQDKKDQAVEAERRLAEDAARAEDAAERRAAEGAAAAKAAAEAARGNETANTGGSQEQGGGWHPTDTGLPSYAPATFGTQGGAIGDDCWVACGKKAGACFDEETGKGFCGKPGNWAGSCCRAGAVGAQHAPECGAEATSSRGCSLNHCCIDDVRRNP